MPGLMPSGPASRAAIWGALSVAGFVMIVIVQPGGSINTRNIDDSLQAVAPLFVAAPLCLWRATSSTGRMRTFWLMLAAAAVAWGCGQLTWCYLEVARHQLPTASEWPTVGFLLAIALVALALIIYPGPHLHWAARLRALIDGLLIVTTLLFVSWTIASDTGALERSGTSLLQKITVLAYPAADIVVIAMLVMVFARGFHSVRDPLLMIGAAVLMLFLGDSLSIYVGLSSTYQTGSAIDVFWFTAFLLVGIAALVEPLPQADVESTRYPPTWTEFIAYGPLGLAMAMALVQLIRRNGFDTIEEALVLVSFLLLIVRGALFIVENGVLVSRIESTIDELQWLTLHDPLTGLANRVLFSDRLNQACASQQRDPQNLAVAYLDLDAFKSVNDSLGHDAGDELLRHVGERISATVREIDTLARLSGDEFAILLPAVDGTPQIDEILGRILAQFDTFFTIDSHAVRISASIGYAVSFGDTDAESLLKQADEAMYAAKAGGRNRISKYPSHADRTVGVA